MMNWMMVHPWMTFFLILAAIEAVSNIVSSICTAIVSCNNTKYQIKGKQDLLNRMEVEK